MPKLESRFARAVASLVGTTIGAGMFALPYVFFRSGLLLAAPLLLLVGFLSTKLNELYAQVIVKTEGDHQLPGYAQIYLGDWGRALAVFSLTFGLYGALVVYVLQGGKFLSLLVPFNLDTLSILFWFALSVLLILGLRVTSASELFFAGGILVLVLFLSLLSIFRFTPSNFNLWGFSDFRTLLSHFGVVLFALGGTSAIPEVEEIMRVEREKLPRVIELSSYLVLALYFAFSLTVVGTCGEATTPAASDGLGSTLGRSASLLGSALGIFALGSSYLLLAYSLREVYLRDLGISKPLAWLLALVPPILIVLFSNLGFISILSITGTIGIGLSWFLVLLIHLRSKR